MEKLNNWDVETIQDYLSSRIAELIEISPDDVDITKAFSDYSIDSASGVELSGDIEEQFNLKLSPLVLFEYPTIEKLSGYVFRKLNK